MLWKKCSLRVLEYRFFRNIFRPKMEVVLEYSFLRKIFRPKMEVVTGGWFSCYGRNIGRECWSVGFLGRYLDLRWRLCEEAGENYIMRSFLFLFVYY